MRMPRTLVEDILSFSAKSTLVRTKTVRSPAAVHQRRRAAIVAGGAYLPGRLGGLDQPRCWPLHHARHPDDKHDKRQHSVTRCDKST